MEEIIGGKYKGKFIQDYSKKELIEIIWELNMGWQKDNERHQKDLDKIYGE